jgi:uncharacterized protein (TIGR00255 family)
MRSMTSFARETFALRGTEYTLEIRSVNSRFREVATKLPFSQPELEEHVRQKVADYINRGRVHLSITRDKPVDAAVKVDFNESLARGFCDALLRLRESLGLAGDIDISMMTQLKDLFIFNVPKEDEEGLWLEIEPLLDQALRAMVAMRLREGTALERDLRERLAFIETTLERIDVLKENLVSDYAARLKEKTKVLTEGLEIDDQRLAMEVAILADKSDVTEELVRLRSHLEQFRGIMASEEPVGRKLDFLVQEINREVNTIGSKVNNAEISQMTVEVKSQLEKIREQIQNIE